MSRRYVILHHETPPGSERGSHYDFMLQRGDVLATWALERVPLAGETVAALKLPDHRLAYLDYEGLLTGGRGTVRRVEAGTYQVEREADDALTVRLVQKNSAEQNPSVDNAARWNFHRVDDGDWEVSRPG